MDYIAQFEDTSIENTRNGFSNFTKKQRETDEKTMPKCNRKISNDSSTDHSSVKEEGFKDLRFVLSPERLEDAKLRGNGVVYTRFPPEPNGSLHIGHAKALSINFKTAKTHNGKFILRFDDTNPVNASQTHCINILEMIEWLGYIPDKVTYASNYFDVLFILALNLIGKDLAYVCHQGYRKYYTPKERASLFVSPSRNNPVKKNIKEFFKMQKGVYKEGEAVLRLKFQTKDGFDDPVIYRINLKSHYRTGDSWKIYPTYDFAHCICDSLENISISLCSKEFKSHRLLYDWILQTLDLPILSQREYSRINIPFNITSKSSINLIKDFIDGFDDPRLVTLSSLRRRGFSSEIINMFVENGNYTYDTLLDITRKQYSEVPRISLIIDPIECTIINYHEVSEELYANYLRNNRESIFNNIPKFSNKIFINRFDFRDTNDQSKHHLTLQSVVRLKHFDLVLKVINVIKSTEGKLERLDVTLKLSAPNDLKGIKTITWVADPLVVQLNLFDQLLNSRNPKKKVIAAELNTRSWMKKEVLVEKEFSEIAITKKPFIYNQVYQAERIGYVAIDKNSTGEMIHLNLVCFLKLKEAFKIDVMSSIHEVVDFSNKS